ncbi:unnamed protein product [Linum trigynum]|uniref:Uncharacterized protein n=1 Tax=Linum trigynum TaxID=586398 RepID=A0AAV2GZG1_9ROSI
MKPLIDSFLGPHPHHIIVVLLDPYITVSVCQEPVGPNNSSCWENVMLDLIPFSNTPPQTKLNPLLEVCTGPQYHVL